LITGRITIRYWIWKIVRGKRSFYIRIHRQLDDDDAHHAKTASPRLVATSVGHVLELRDLGSIGMEPIHQGGVAYRRAAHEQAPSAAAT
jgi:hypothetical protein